MRVVVFSPADTFTESTLPGLSSDDRVVVVCWAGSTEREGVTIVQLRRNKLADSLARTAGRNVLLRTLLRVSPLDPGVVFWRAVRGCEAVLREVGEADLLVAAERDGGYATWKTMRRLARSGRRQAAVSGYPAARAAVERLR